MSSFRANEPLQPKLEVTWSPPLESTPGDKWIDFRVALLPFVRHTALEDYDFGPDRGLGMRATKDIQKGQAVLVLDANLAITPQKVRQMLAGVSPDFGETLPEVSMDTLAPGQVLLVIEDADRVLQHARQAGIFEDNDKDRVAIAGKTVRVMEVDETDDTVSVKTDGFDEVWISYKSLTLASLTGLTVDFLRDEDVLTAYVLGMRFRKRWTAQRRIVEEDAWRAHALMMPEKINSPIFWADRDLAELDGCTCADRAKAMQKQAKASHSVLKCFGVDIAGTFDEYCWALAAVRSRTFGIGPSKFPRLGAESAVMLMPMLDMLNHDPALEEETLEESSDGTCIVFRAAADYRRGEEVFTSYGFKPSGDLLLGWGFVPPNNPSDVFELQMETEYATTGSKRYMLCRCIASDTIDAGCMVGTPRFERIDVPSGNFAARALLSRTRPVLPPQLLSLCRLEKVTAREFEVLSKHLDEVELIRCLRTGSLLGISLPAGAIGRRIGALADLRACTSLYMAVHGLLHDFPTTLAQDGEIAAQLQKRVQQQPDVLQRLLPRIMAVEYRVSQKDILQQVLAELSRMLNLACQWPLLELAKLSADERAAGTRHPITATSLLLNELSRMRLGSESEAAATWVQSCSFIFLCFHGLEKHMASWRAVIYPARWPISPPKTGHGIPSYDYINGVTQEDNQLQVMYNDKMRLWGCFLTSQLYAEGTVNISDMNVMAKESVSIRKRFAWSVPSEESLNCIGKYAPLLEMGAGTGYWANLLHRRGFDIQAFSLQKFNPSFNSPSAAGTHDWGELERYKEHGVVKEGGPEMLSNVDDRNLLLMWPDYGVHPFRNHDALEKLLSGPEVLVWFWRDRGWILARCTGIWVESTQKMA